DGLAARVVEDTAYYLAVGAMNAMHVIDPDMVVFGGGMIAAGDGFLERIRRHVRDLAFPVPAERTQIRYAPLRGDARLIGAAAGARQLYRTGPPVGSARRAGRGQMLSPVAPSRVERDDLSAVDAGQGLPGRQVDRVGDEMHAAVHARDVYPAGVIAARRDD